MNTESSIMFPAQRWSHIRIVYWLILCLLLTGCGGMTATTTTLETSTSCPSASQLTGAGSTFDAPLFAQMFRAYASTACGVTVTYHSVGSAAGMNALLDGMVDFGATDTPMTNGALARSQHGPILHIPVTLGAEAIVYHMAGVSGHVKFTGPVLAAIYLGQITSWDDPAITQLNPGVALPHQSITVIHRADGSGTTGIFTTYLSHVNPAWKTQVGAAVIVNWPVGIGYQGNGGVADGVQATDGSIGYVELSYALSLHLPYAALQNAAGNFLLPSIAGAQADAANIQTIPADLRFFIVNARGAAAYPISGYSFVIVYQRQSNAQTGQGLAQLLWWMIHDGQRYAAPLNYAPLPAAIVARSEAQIRLLQCGANNARCYTS
jgi:phosphate transport system substrate-binding protein